MQNFIKYNSKRICNRVILSLLLLLIVSFLLADVPRDGLDHPAYVLPLYVYVPPKDLKSSQHHLQAGVGSRVKDTADG